MTIERPLDLLNSLKGKNVLVKVKDSMGYINGVLLAYDIHINLVVEIKQKPTFIRGESVISVA